MTRKSAAARARLGGRLVAALLEEAAPRLGPQGPAGGEVGLGRGGRPPPRLSRLTEWTTSVPPGASRVADGGEQLGALAAGHAVDDPAQHDAAQAGRGHGAQVLRQGLAAQVEGAELGRVDERGERGSTP